MVSLGKTFHLFKLHVFVFALLTRNNGCTTTPDFNFNFQHTRLLLDNLLGGRKIIYDDLFFNSDQGNTHEYLTFAVICDAIACSIENREFVYCYKYSFVNMVVFCKKP